jgi:membrane protein required for colicin V production
MTIFDYTVMAIVLVSIAVGVIRGLVRELLSLVGWIAAFVIANSFASVVAPALPEAVHGERLRVIVAFAVLFLGTLIVSAIIGALVGLLIRQSGLRLADGGLGGLFGLARGIVIVVTAFILLGMTTLPEEPVWRESVLAPWLARTVREIKPYVPQGWSRYVRY